MKRKESRSGFEPLDYKNKKVGKVNTKYRFLEDFFFFKPMHAHCYAFDQVRNTKEINYILVIEMLEKATQHHIRK